MMNDKITIQAPPTGRDAAGQEAGDWTDVATVWAGMHFQTGAEVLRAGLAVSTVRASVMIHEREDITNAMRIIYKGVPYHIKAILPNSKDRQFMFLVCESAK